MKYISLILLVLILSNCGMLDPGYKVPDGPEIHKIISKKIFYKASVMGSFNTISGACPIETFLDENAPVIYDDNYIINNIPVFDIVVNPEGKDVWINAHKEPKLHSMGVNTSISIDRIIDSNANYNQYLYYDRYCVKNEVTGEIARITGYVSGVELVLENDIMLNVGESYSIYKYWTIYLEIIAVLEEFPYSKEMIGLGYFSGINVYGEVKGKVYPEVFWSD